MTGFIPIISFAQDKKLPVLQPPDLKVSIPNMQTLEKVQCNGEKCYIPWLGQYITGIQRYTIGIVGIIAVIVLMIGGIIWLTSAGNQSQIEKAKKMIGSSLVGLFLVFGSYLILLLINPSLTKFKPLEIRYIPNAKLDTEEPIVSGFASDGVSYTPQNNNTTIATTDQLFNLNTEKSLFSYFIKTANANTCTLTLHINNDGVNIKNNFFSTNSVPSIHCPHSGGAKAITRILLDMNAKQMITYRFGGKGAPPPYQDGEGGDHGHTCNQDPGCADQLKGHEKEDDNCKYCCPEGQACLDCSGFVNHVLSCAGLPIVDSGTDTMNGCQEKIGEDEKVIDFQNNSVNGIPLVPGDLLVTDGHVVIYMGGGLTAESVPTPDKKVYDSGRRPGKGLLILPLKRPPPYHAYDFTTIIRSSQELYEMEGECRDNNVECDRSDQCCNGLICENGRMNNQYGGSCQQCVNTWQWNCTRNSDCCSPLDKCRKQPDNHWKCWTGLIPDHEWDCETKSDCLNPLANCEFDEGQQRNVCRPPH